MNEERIRKRQSYADWLRVLKFLNQNPKPSTILKKIHEIIDDRKGYGSERNSFYSRESLALLIKDKAIR